MDKLENMVLNVHQLTKTIAGRKIVDSVSFQIRRGEILGFLGPNGAGKTTTIRMLVNLISPTEGTVELCGHDVQRDPEGALSHVGCIVENPEAYPYMSGLDNLELSARMLSGVSRSRISEVAEIVQLGDRIHDKVKTYSLGMRQRLGIAQALLGRPSLLILDEPSNGLDPQGIKQLRDFLHQLAEGGLSLLVSSHLLSEMQLLCRNVLILNEGRVVAQGELDDLMLAAKRYVYWHFGERKEGLAALKAVGHVVIEGHRGREGISDDVVVTLMPEEGIEEALRSLVYKGIAVQAVYPAEPSLEELFLHLTGRNSYA